MATFPPHKRILLLGPTGVDKAAVVERLRARLKSKLGHAINFVDFENAYLKKRMGVKNWMSFLAQDITQQANSWRAAWDDFRGSIGDEIIVLGLHATYVSGALGLRCAINIPAICDDFQPSLIISLIDDVYSMWHRTEARAEGKDHKGRPSFEQLLVARRAEQLLGDVILTHTRISGARHVVCATGNSLDALVNLIIFDAAATYLSFPISAPRKLAMGGDNSFVDIINRAHQLAAAEMVRDRTRAFISPLAIDELPIVFKAEAASGADSSLHFNPHRERWNLTELWGDSELAILPALDQNLTFPMEQISHADGVIRTDVGWRDRRLVLQANSLAIVCPKPPGEDRITRGVAEEIQTAVTIGIVCNYWQNPDWDTGNFLGTQFPEAGSMGIGQTQAFVQRSDTLDALIRSKP